VHTLQISDDNDDDDNISASNNLQEGDIFNSEQYSFIRLYIWAFMVTKKARKIWNTHFHKVDLADKYFMQ